MLLDLRHLARAALKSITRHHHRRRGEDRQPRAVGRRCFQRGDPRASRWPTAAEDGIGTPSSDRLGCTARRGPREFIYRVARPAARRRHPADPVDPARRTRWTFSASLGLGFQPSAPTQPAGGSTAPFHRPAAAHPGSRAAYHGARGDARASTPTPFNPNWAWLNDLRALWPRQCRRRRLLTRNLDIIELAPTSATGFASTPHWCLPAPDVKLLGGDRVRPPPRSATVPDAANPTTSASSLTLGLAFTLNSFFLAPRRRRRVAGASATPTPRLRRRGEAPTPTPSSPSAAAR